jgi:hypothetical protein
MSGITSVRPYPFVLSPPAIDELRFVPDVIDRYTP